MRRSLCLLLSLAVFISADDKRQDYGAAPFVLGSRYGRSPPRMLAPRNDRFFMGSRYGKRSPPPPSAPTLLVCELSPGSSDLYRCVNIRANKRDDDMMD